MCAIYTYLMISYFMVVTTNIVFGNTYYYKGLKDKKGYGFVSYT